MLITNLLTYFNKVKRFYDMTSREIMFHQTRSRSIRDKNNANNNFFIKYYRNINFHDLYKKFIYENLH